MCFAPQRRALFRHFFDIWTSKSGPRPSVFNTFDLEMCFAPQRRALFRHRNFKKWSDHGVFCTFWLGNVRATTACTFSTSQLQKVVRPWCVLYILTWTCASRHNGVHFFDIATSKSGPRLVCFVHFDLEMCFAPQRRALFRHRNFKKWSEFGVFCTFWLGNVRATTACTFSSLIWPAGSAPAALASLLFDPPEPQIIGKTQWIATFSVSRRSYLFAHLHLLSSVCFSTVHIVGSFTSKLPSNRLQWVYHLDGTRNHEHTPKSSHLWTIEFVYHNLWFARHIFTDNSSVLWLIIEHGLLLWISHCRCGPFFRVNCRRTRVESPGVAVSHPLACVRCMNVVSHPACEKSPGKNVNTMCTLCYPREISWKKECLAHAEGKCDCCLMFSMFELRITLCMSFWYDCFMLGIKH